MESAANLAGITGPNVERTLCSVQDSVAGVVQGAVFSLVYFSV